MLIGATSVMAQEVQTTQTSDLLTVRADGFVRINGEVVLGKGVNYAVKDGKIHLEADASVAKLSELEERLKNQQIKLVNIENEMLSMVKIENVFLPKGLTKKQDVDNLFVSFEEPPKEPLSIGKNVTLYIVLTLGIFSAFAILLLFIIYL